MICGNDVRTDSLVRNVALAFGCDEARPRFPSIATEQIIVMIVEVDVVCVRELNVQRVRTFLEVGVELVGAEHLGDLDELIVVVVTVEEGLLSEDLCESALRAVQELAMLANMQPSDHISSE